MRSAFMYSCMPNPSEAPMSVALMSCLLCVDATEPCPRLAPAGESARSPFWFSRDISRRSAGGEKIDPRVRMGQVRTQVSTGLQISRPRAFRGPFGLGKALQKATSSHSTTHEALFTAMSAFTVASNLTSRVALPKARAARRTARRAAHGPVRPAHADGDAYRKVRRRFGVVPRPSDQRQHQRGPFEVAMGKKAFCGYSPSVRLTAGERHQADSYPR